MAAYLPSKGVTQCASERASDSKDEGEGKGLDNCGEQLPVSEWNMFP